MDNLFFLDAKCRRTKKDFYLRYDLAADGYWTLTYGVKSIDTEDKGKTGNSHLSISKVKTGPQYRCPYCGNESFVKCGRCGKLTCNPANEKTFECVHCGNKGNISGYITTDSYNQMEKRKGQGQ